MRWGADRTWITLVVMLVGACRTAPSRNEPNPLLQPPIDSVRVRSVEEAAGWPYRREATADVDGDGTSERIVLACDVTVRPDGAPLWEDGHRWAVYVEAAGGRRTLLYAAFVPNGFTEAALTIPDDRGRRRVLVQERTPQQLRALEVEYLGPGEARSHSGAYYQVEQWLPGSASLGHEGNPETRGKPRVSGP